MKKLFFTGIMALGLFTAGAQIKIGYINTEELMGVMPETKTADAEMQEFQASLAQAGQEKLKELGVKDSLFVKDSAKLSPTMKEIKRGELIKLYQEVQNWNNQSQEMYNQKANEKMTPIRQKALEAIKNVAKENSFSYVLDINSVIVGPPGDDILPLVKKKLGIKESATPVSKTPGIKPN